jgi:hypothetical protein
MNFNHNRVYPLEPHSLTRYSLRNPVFFLFSCMQTCTSGTIPTNRRTLARAVSNFSTTYPTDGCRTCASAQV